MDETSKNDQKFADITALLALKEESKSYNFVKASTESSNGRIQIGLEIRDGENGKSHPDSSISAAEEDEDAKLATLLQEEENWQSMRQKKTQGSASFSNKFYIKINEDEIANDYPLPAYYQTSNQETDEFLVFDSDFDICDPEDLPRSMLHNWALYNSDSRLIPLELLPMKPCADMDVTVFGSGVMTSDDGSGFFLDNDNSSSSSGAQNVDGIPIYLSAIKEWMIELGSSMIFVSIRTDMAWYLPFPLLDVTIDYFTPVTLVIILPQ